MKTSILLIEDSPTLSVVYQEYLAGFSEAIKAVESGEEALKLIASDLPKVVLLDLNLPDIDGMEILKSIQDDNIPTVVVIITAHGSVDVAVEAMKYGAFDFISKPFDAKRLQVTVRNALNHFKLSSIVSDYKEQFERETYFDFIGSSLAMQGVYRIIESAAPSKATVFITGESGTGKELCAEAIHKQSPRCDKPFIALNCAAIPRELMESEIFGHIKGAFTGAVKERQGAAALADGGTLFLDEICEMDLELQSKILRFIQTGSFQQVGSSKLNQVDVRFICATNRDPLLEVKEGRFREDLYYRLHVIPIQLPPLKERGTDVLLIAQAFLTEYAKEEQKDFKSFSKQTEQVLLSYGWPGNIRQLQNVIRNLVVLNNAEVVTPELLPPPLNSLPSMSYQELMSDAGAVVKSEPITKMSFEITGDVLPLWLAEKQTIENAIERCDGNIPKAAALLEVSPSTLYRKKQQWEEKILDSEG